MSYQQFQQVCNDCKVKWNAAFGIVGTTQIATPPTTCPNCGSGNISKFADGWKDYSPRLYTEAEVTERERLAVAGALAMLSTLIDVRLQNREPHATAWLEPLHVVREVIKQFTPADAQRTLEQRIENERLAVAGACHQLLDHLFSGYEILANGNEVCVSGDPDDCEFQAENDFTRQDAERLIPADAQAELDARVQEAYQQGIEQGLQTHKIALEQALKRVKLEARLEEAKWFEQTFLSTVALSTKQESQLKERIAELEAQREKLR